MEGREVSELPNITEPKGGKVVSNSAMLYKIIIASLSASHLKFSTVNVSFRHLTILFWMVSFK
jgi:hypothetical protein